MENIDVRDFLKKNEETEIEDARRKMPYRISVGQALLNDEELNKKWANFVKNATDGFGHGLLLDETLQIMGMIKAGVHTDKIRETLSKIESNKTVVNYLRDFINPEIVCEIDLDNSMDIKIQD